MTATLALAGCDPGRVEAEHGPNILLTDPSSAQFSGMWWHPSVPASRGDGESLGEGRSGADRGVDVGGGRW